MSLFSTLLPLDLKAFQVLLDGVTKGAAVESVTLPPDNSGVVITWHTPNLNSRVSWAVPFSLDLLKGKDLPPGVLDQRTPSPNPVLPPPPPPPLVVQKPPAPPPDPNFKDPAPMPAAKGGLFKRAKRIDKPDAGGEYDGYKEAKRIDKPEKSGDK